MTYQRERDRFRGLGFPAGVIDRAMAEPNSAAATWAILRGLCAHLRFNVRSPLGCRPRYMRVLHLARDETALLRRQREARAEA